MSDSVKDDAQGCLGLLLLALIASFLWLTWPVWTILVATTGAWWLVREREDWWGRASASILASTSFGVGTVCVLLFGFNAFKRTLEPRWLYDLESTLVTLRIWLRDKTSLSLPTFVILVTGLVVMSYVLPRLKPVSRFFAVKSWISKIVVALIAATSFSFFSQVPLEQFAVDAHERLAADYRWRIDRYRVLLRQEWNEVGRYLAATYLEENIADLAPTDQATYRELFSQIYQASRQEEAKMGPAYSVDLRFDGILDPAGIRTRASSVSTSVAQRFAARHYETAMGSQAAESGSLESWITHKLGAMTATAAEIQRKPATVDDWVRYRALATAQERDYAEQEKAKERATVRANERVLALKKTFTEVVRQGVPAIDGLAGEYVKELAKKFSEYVADEVVRRSARDPTMESPRDVANEFGKSPETVRFGVITRAVTITSKVLEGGGATEVLRQETIEIIRNEAKLEAAREVETIKLERDAARRQTEAMREEIRVRERLGRAPRGR